MRKIARFLLLLALGVMVGWSNPVYAADDLGSESNLSEGEAGLQAAIEGCYELIDDELIAVEELEEDKVYFISAALKNVADQNVGSPTVVNKCDEKYNDELYGIQFRFKLPVSVNHEASSQIILKASACRRNYDDRCNQSEDTLVVRAKEGLTLALEFAPGYCSVDTLKRINSYQYYLRSEEEYTIVGSNHDSETPIASGAERMILLAIHTRNTQEFAEKRELNRTSHLQTSFASLGTTGGTITRAMPIVGSVPKKTPRMLMPELLYSNPGSVPRGLCPEVVYFDNTSDNCLVAQVEIPKWLEQHPNDQWYLETKCKVYTTNDGEVGFWAGLYNHETIYDLSSTSTQALFNSQASLVYLNDIEAWYVDQDGEKVTLAATDIESLPDLSTEPSPSLVLEHNGISARIALSDDLVSKLAGKKIYFAYSYSQVKPIAQ